MSETQSKYGLYEYCPKCEEILVANNWREGQLYCANCKRFYKPYQAMLKSRLVADDPETYCSNCNMTVLTSKEKEEGLDCIFCRPAGQDKSSCDDIDDNQGIKYDDGKLPYELIPWEIMDGLAEVYKSGAKEYGVDNWRTGFRWRRIIGATFRHLKDWVIGVDHDSKTGLHHLDCVVWNALTLRWMQKYGRGKDDRYIAKNHDSCSSDISNITTN